MSKETAETLKKAKALIDAPEKLARGEYARDADGQQVEPHDERAVCRCSVGALMVAMGVGESVAEASAGALALDRARLGGVPGFSVGSRITKYSDSLTHEQAMAWWDRAIATESATTAGGAEEVSS